MSYDYLRADSVASAQQAFAEGAGGTRFLAGGTDLLIQIKRGIVKADRLVDIRFIPELHGITIGSEIEIGACVRHREIERHPHFLARIEALCEASRVVGGVQVRNMGTVGGNLVNASPAADLNPVLLALDAQVDYRDDGRDLSAPLDGFVTGRGATLMSQTGIVTRVRFNAPVQGTGTAFLKAGRRRAMEISLVNVAVALSLAGDKVSAARIVLGAVGPTMMRAQEAETLLIGTSPDDTLIEKAGDLAAKRATPRDDVRASADYRRHMVQVLVRRAIGIALTRARKDATS